MAQSHRSINPHHHDRRSVATASLRSAQLNVMTPKHRKGRVTLTQAQYPTTCMRDHSRSLEHQLLHHRLDATAFGLVAHRCIRFVQSVLSNQTQQIHRHCRQLAHQIVGTELTRGQALQIHIGLELQMKLLMRGVVTIQRNHFRGNKFLWQCCRPSLQHILGQVSF